jgi:hypothetical protein
MAAVGREAHGKAGDGGGWRRLTAAKYFAAVRVDFGKKREAKQRASLFYTSIMRRT